MQKNTDKYYKTLVKDRLIPANKNKTYKELVDVLFSDTVDCIDPKILRKTKKRLYLSC